MCDLFFTVSFFGVIPHFSPCVSPPPVLPFIQTRSRLPQVKWLDMTARKERSVLLCFSFSCIITLKVTCGESCAFFPLALFKLTHRLIQDLNEWGMHTIYISYFHCIEICPLNVRNYTTKECKSLSFSFQSIKKWSCDVYELNMDSRFYLIRFEIN